MKLVTQSSKSMLTTLTEFISLNKTHHNHHCDKNSSRQEVIGKRLHQVPIASHSLNGPTLQSNNQGPAATISMLVKSVHLLSLLGWLLLLSQPSSTGCLATSGPSPRCLASGGAHQASSQWKPVRDWPQLADLIQRSEHSVITNANSNSSNPNQASSQAQAQDQQAATSHKLQQQQPTGWSGDQLNNNQSMASQRSQQEPFQSICMGWHNVIPIGSAQDGNQANGKPLALWSYDPTRGALVAKFLFYDRADRSEFSSRVATLRSSRFPAIPGEKLRDCKLYFSSYSTIPAHLELNLIELHSERHQTLKTLMEGKLSRGERQARKGGESSAWLHHEVPLAASLGQMSPPPHGSIRLEFTAVPAMVTSSYKRRSDFLQGVAIKNISLSDECQPPNSNRNAGAASTSMEAAADDGNQMTNHWADNGDDPYGSTSDQDEASHSSASHSSSDAGLAAMAAGHDPDQESIIGLDGQTSGRQISMGARGNDKSQLLTTELPNGKQVNPLRQATSWLANHKLQVILFGSLALLCLGTLIQLCLVSAKMNLPLETSTTTSNRPIDNHQSLGSPLLACLMVCCPHLALKMKRDRVYTTDQQSSSKHRRYSIGQGPKGGPLACQRPSQDELNNSLVALGHFLDDVELNENPHYKSLLMNEAKRLSPLVAYQIDRKRITLTRLLGKGAFGQVYQGYLVCYNSGDNEDLADNQRALFEEENKLLPMGESQLHLTDEMADDEEDPYSLEDRRRRLERRLEYANCSQSREQLDTHSIPVAVKILTENGVKKIDFLLEATSMSTLLHRNIVGFIGVSFDEEPRYLVMEYLAGGNLKQFLIKNRTYSQSPKQLAGAGAIPRSSPSPGPTTDSLIISLGDQTRAQHAHWSNGNQPKLSSSSLLSESNNSNSAHDNAPRRLPSASSCINIGDLLVIALDIARACDYLQKRKIIHRDLAARNCLLSSTRKRFPSAQQLFSHSSPNRQQPTSGLGRPFMSSFGYSTDNSNNNNNKTNDNKNQFQVTSLHQEEVDLEQVYLNGYQESGIVAKLADFGMTREIDQHSDYYRSSSNEMPIRWMPPESLNGITTNKSDVWSFGVLMWEIFSLGQIPYPDIADNNQVYRMIRARASPRVASAASSPRSNQFTQGAAPGAAAPSPNGQHPDSHQVKQKDGQCNNNSQTDLMDRQLLLGHSTGSGELDESSAVSVQTANNQSLSNSTTTTTTTLVNNNNQNNSVSQTKRQVALDIDEPPLGPPYPELPTPIYEIMCSCWASKAENRPQFEEIAMRLYWCLQRPEIVSAPLLVFPSQADGQSTPSSLKSAHRHPQRTTKTQSSPRPVGSKQPTDNQFSWWAPP